MLYPIQFLDAAAGLALACILLAVERSLAALDMAGGALLNLLHIDARVLHVVFYSKDTSSVQPPCGPE